MEKTNELKGTIKKFLQNKERLVKINRTIAEFMGYEVANYGNRPMYNGNKCAQTIGKQKELWGGLNMHFNGRFVENVNYPFNTSFDCLIPVIRKIEEQGYVVAIQGISYKVYEVLNEQNPIVSLVCGDLSKKTEMTCDLIVSFIERLNEKSPQQ